MLGAGVLGRPRGMVWGGRREEGSGWGTHVYLWRKKKKINKTFSNMICKINSKEIKDLNATPDTTKLLEENRQNTLT